MNAQNINNMESQSNYYISSVNDGNIALHTSLSALEAQQNRAAIAAKLGFSVHKLVSMQQVHQANVHIVDSQDAGKGSQDWDSALPQTDGLVTNVRGLVLLAQGADCPLLLFHDKKMSVIGVAHAGWKGVVAGIAIKMLETMHQAFNCHLEDIEITIAPHAGACCYEVSQDFIPNFSAFPPEVFILRNRKLFLDLDRALVWQLTQNAVKHINLLDICTICSNDYFSFRREKDRAGRFGLFAWL